MALIKPLREAFYDSRLAISILGCKRSGRKPRLIWAVASILLTELSYAEVEYSTRDSRGVKSEKERYAISARSRTRGPRTEPLLHSLHSLPSPHLLPAHDRNSNRSTCRNHDTNSTFRAHSAALRNVTWTNPIGCYAGARRISWGM